MRLIDADALLAECELAQKQAVMDGREFANAFYSGGGEVSTEWWCVEDMIENAKTIEPEPVVRCGECVYWSSKETKYCNMLKGTFQENDYCSYGERKGADE